MELFSKEYGSNDTLNKHFYFNNQGGNVFEINPTGKDTNVLNNNNIPIE